MTMEIVKEDVNKPEPATKRMGDMIRGEVCWINKDSSYIVCIEHDEFPKIYLSLRNYDSAQTYGSVDQLDLIVRELYPGESITIKFS